MIDRADFTERAAKFRKAYEAGKKAIENGFERVSPYYEDHWMDWWFCVGWDGLDEDQAWVEFRKANERGMLEIVSVPKGAVN